MHRSIISKVISLNPYISFLNISKKDFFERIVTGFLYFLSIQLAFLLPNSEIIMAPNWFAIGGALAIFLLNPKKLWTILFLILTLFCYFAYYISIQGFSTNPIIPIANVLGALGSAWVFNYFCGDSVKISSIKEIIILIISATFITAVSSFIASISIAFPAEELMRVFWLTHWISSGVGIIIITPLIILFANFRNLPLHLNWKRIFEFGIFLIFWCILSRFIFSSMNLFHPITLHPYMISALLPWVALRFGMRWVVFSCFIMTLITITSPSVMVGPFVWGGDSLIERMQILQIFLGFTSISGYLLATSFAETKISEMHLRKLMESALDSVITIDQKGIIIGWDSQSEAFFGWSSTEVFGKNIKDLIIPEAFREKHERGMERFLLTGIEVILNKHVEIIAQHRDGHTFPVELSVIPIRRDNSTIIFTAFVRNITERKKADEQLRKLSRAIEQSASSIVITDTKGSIEYVNRRFMEMTGYSYQEAIGKNSRILKSGHTQPEEYKDLWDTILSGGEWRGEFENTKKNGEHFWEFASISPILNEIGDITHFLAVKEDITDRKKAEEALEKSLQQKDLLLSEIHHRVKNNLQVISSIISMEAHLIKDKDAVKYLKSTASRVHAIGLLHNKLYKSIDFSRIDMLDYLSSIVNQIFTVQDFNGHDISIVYDIENIFMNIDTSMPCGLIVNEIITNSIKYAFQEGSGEIGISIHFTDNAYTMKVYDTGKGFPENTNFNQNSGLGLKLITALTKQLHGSVTIEKEKGTCYIFSFKEILKEEKRWKSKK